jgi:hypothetical protein
LRQRGSGAKIGIGQGMFLKEGPELICKWGENPLTLRIKTDKIDFVIC